MRLGALAVVITSMVLQSSVIDDLARLALIGLFADWAYQLYKRT